MEDEKIQNIYLKKNKKIKAISVNINENASIINSKLLQSMFKKKVSNKKYKNRATGYIASVTAETKSKIMNPSQKVNKRGKEYILRIIAACNLPILFRKAVYIDSLPAMKGKEKNINELYYHQFVAPIVINNNLYRIILCIRNKQNSRIIYSLNIEKILQKNDEDSFIINLSDLVNNIKIFNYNLNLWQVYNVNDIK